MSAVPFDTLKYAEALKTAGVPEAQAKAQAGALVDALWESGHGLATKADIADLRAGAKLDIAELKTEIQAMKGEIQAMLNRHLLAVLAVLGAMVGLTGIFGVVVAITLRLVK